MSYVLLRLLPARKKQSCLGFSHFSSRFCLFRNLPVSWCYLRLQCTHFIHFFLSSTQITYHLISQKNVRISAVIKKPRIPDFAGRVSQELGLRSDDRSFLVTSKPSFSCWRRDRFAHSRPSPAPIFTSSQHIHTLYPTQSECVMC